MIVIDKICLWLKTISQDDTHYQRLLEQVYINPDYRNKECPYTHSCGNCKKNLLKKGRV